jgi:NAD-dependent protein deacetylase/lipoamidase
MVTLQEIAGEVGRGGRIAVLTGAGISAESGISTFRDAGGLWERHSIEDVATPEGFARDPELVQRFYNQRRRRLPEVNPNAAHLALARLEEALGERLTLITQNVDDLHERAGSRRVLHMHGELLKARCCRCEAVSAWPGDIAPHDRCPSCGAGLRPHVVWFGEMPFFMDREIPEALGSEVFVSIGTSGVVYPAAGFVAEARRNGALTVEINLEPTPNARLFQLTLAGKASERVPEFVAAVTAGR